MSDITPQEQEEFEFRHRLEQEQAATQKAAPAEDERINPMLPTIGGALAAEALGPTINKASEAFMETQKLIKSGWDPKVASDFVRGKFSAVENWGRQMHGGEWFGGRDMPEAWRQGMAAKYPGGVPPNPVPGGPMPSGGPIPSGPTPGAVPPGAANATRAGRAAASPAFQSTKAALGAASTGIVPAVIGRGLAGGSAAFQGVDAYNRMKSGDISGGVISGLGALGSAASMLPHPVARIGGTAIGVGAEALNAYLDSLKKKPAMAKGGHVTVDKKDGLSKAEKAALLIMNNKKKLSI